MIIEMPSKEEHVDHSQAEAAVQTLVDITQEINSVLKFLKVCEINIISHLTNSKSRVELKTLELLFRTHGTNLVKIADAIDKHLTTKVKPLSKEETRQALMDYVRAGDGYDEKREPIIFDNYHTEYLNEEGLRKDILEADSI